MNGIRTTLAVALLGAVAACSAPMGGRAIGVGSSSARRHPQDKFAFAPPTAEAVPLLSREGGVVEPPAPGSVTQGGAPTHDVEPASQGRMYIVELYQQAIEERDALQIEVEGLYASVEELQSAVAASEEALAERDARIARLEEDGRALLDENVDLAARLATAQIRRLEAEKMLLETKIAWLEGRGTPAPAPAATSSPDVPPAAATPTPGSPGADAAQNEPVPPAETDGATEPIGASSRWDLPADDPR